MSTLAGPFLKFVRCSNNEWVVSAILVADSDKPPVLSWSVVSSNTKNTPPKPRDIFRNGPNAVVWRYQWSVPLQPREQTVEYTIDKQVRRFVVPAEGKRLRLGYASCNGFHSLNDMKSVVPNAMWGVLPAGPVPIRKDKAGPIFTVLHQHLDEPIHLLLMGGDQVYADSIWLAVPAIREWVEGDDKWTAKFTRKMETEVKQFYFNLYASRWSKPGPADAFASIPTLMMWDDHDIFDGWGSYDDDIQQSDVYQGIFRGARECFEVFQLHRRPGDAGGADEGLIEELGRNPLRRNLTSCHRINDVAIVALDTRSNRATNTILPQSTWKAVFDWMDAEQGCKHLFLMASIPVVYPKYPAFIEGFMGLWPGQATGHLDSLEDDLRDHWRSGQHTGERLRLIHRLLRFARDNHCRVTILSGDVHLAALGLLSSTRETAKFPNTQTITQLISSPIANLPQPRSGQLALQAIIGNPDAVDRGITAAMDNFPDTEIKVVAARNWLCLDIEKDRRIWAKWWVEDRLTPLWKVIHAPGPS